MAQIAGRRMTVEVDGDFVVFLIGARPTKLRLLRSMIDLGGRRGMKHMLDYLVAHPEKLSLIHILLRLFDERRPGPLVEDLRRAVAELAALVTTDTDEAPPKPSASAARAERKAGSVAGGSP